MKPNTAAHESICRAKAAWSKPITQNELAWVQFIRLASRDTDPPATLELVQKVRLLFSKLDAG